MVEKKDFYELEQEAAEDGTHIPEYPFKAGYIKRDYYCYYADDDGIPEGGTSEKLDTAKKQYGSIHISIYYYSQLKKWMNKWFNGHWALSDIRELLRRSGITKQEELNELSFDDIESIIRVRLMEKKQKTKSKKKPERIEAGSDVRVENKPENTVNIQRGDREKAQALLKAIEEFLLVYDRLEEFINDWILSFPPNFDASQVLIDTLKKEGLTDRYCEVNNCLEKARAMLCRKSQLEFKQISSLLDNIDCYAINTYNDFNGIWFHVDHIAKKKLNREAECHELINCPELKELFHYKRRDYRIEQSSLLSKSIDNLGLRELAGENKKAEPKKVISMVNQKTSKGIRPERDHNIDLLSGKPNYKEKNNLGLSDLAECLWSLDEQIARLGHRGDPFPDSDAFDLNKSAEKTEEILAIMSQLYQQKKNPHIREAMITLSKLNRDLKAAHLKMNFASAPTVVTMPDGEDNSKEVEGEVNSILETFYNRTCPQIKQVYHPALMDIAATFETDSKLSSQIISDEIDQSSVLLDNIHSVVRNLKKVANPDVDYDNLTQLEMAIADEAVLNYLTERFGQQDDAVGNWPRDWHECPEAIELWKKTIRDIWLSRSIDNLTSAQKEIETDRKKITPSIAASNNHNSILEKRQELIEGITPDLFDWETPFTPKQIEVIEQKLGPLAKDIDGLAEFIEKADDFIKDENNSWYQWTSDDMMDCGFDHSGFSKDVVSWVFTSVLSAKSLRAKLEKLMDAADAKEFYQQLQVALLLIVDETGISMDIPGQPIAPERHSPAVKNLIARLRMSASNCKHINYVKKGKVWEFCYNGKTVHVDGKLKGLPLVEYLLTHPNEKPISPFDLERTVCPPPAGKKIADLTEDLIDKESDTGSIRTSATGQNIDHRKLAKTDIVDLERLIEKRKIDLDKKQNEAEAEMIESDILYLQNEIIRRQNKNGKPRPTADDPYEKARVRVTQKIGVVKSKLIEEHKELYNHLCDDLNIGTDCSYTPKTPPKWEIRKM